MSSLITTKAERLPALFQKHPVLSLLRAERGRFAQEGDNSDGVNNDAEAVLAWLHKHRNSPHTLRAYLRHVRTLLEWLNRQSIALSDLTRPMARSFIEWAANPASVDMAERGKLFKKESSPASNNQRLRALSSLYQHMAESGYLSVNPFSGIDPLKISRELELRYRSLSVAQMRALMSVIDEMELLEATHARLIIVGMARLAARRSEAAEAVLGSLICDNNGRWWWHVVGKGKKPAKVPVHDDVIDALRDYRESRGLPRYWSSKSREPLFPGLRGGQVGDNTHYMFIKDLMLRAASRFPDESHEGERLKMASPHWLRHTGISRFAELHPLPVVKEYARHANVNTTAGYATASDDDLHSKNQNVKL